MDETQCVKYANAAAAVFLHAAQEELTGTAFVELLPAQDGFQAVRAALTGARPSRLAVDVDLRPAGGGVWRVHIRPLHLDSGPAVLIVIEDVTQQRLAAETRKAFLAQAAHELRTPLMNIVLYVENAMEDGDDNPALRAKSLNVINQEARRLECMVHDMLSVSEIEAGSMSINRDDVRLEALLEQLEDDYMAQAMEKRIALTFNLPPKVPVIQGDAATVQPASAAQDGFTVEIAGFGKSHAAVARFVARLRRAGLFDEIRLAQTSVEELKSGKAVAFQLRCTLGHVER